MTMGRALFFAGYFGLIGYGVAKSGLDKKIASGMKRGYTELVRYTKEIDTPRVALVQIVPAEKADDGKPDH